MQALSSRDSSWGESTLCPLPLPLGFSHMLYLPDSTSPFLGSVLTQHGLVPCGRQAGVSQGGFLEEVARMKYGDS